MDYRPIRRLADEVIGQIAAGEVVERPAAAVKELVENSIDAGATAVTVELKDGGLTSLRVSDNGRGIPADQLRMAFERHATSKLVSAEELFDVHTLGFRGEALASIAAVARVSCTTRTAGATFGVKADVEAGEWLGVTEAASPEGTSITVRDLFYNAPVRRKFLKKPVTEAALVSDYMLRLILSRPDVAFRFVNQGKTVYRSAGDGTLESAIYCVYGRDALRAMFIAYALFWGMSSTAVTEIAGIPLSFLAWPGIGTAMQPLFRIQGMMWLALPFLLIPTQTSVKMPKWLGYAFYPLHLLLIAIIRLCLGTPLSDLLAVLGKLN